MLTRSSLTIRLHPNDNVVVARIEVGIGTPVPSEGFTSRSQVPALLPAGRSQ